MKNIKYIFLFFAAVPLLVSSCRKTEDLSLHADLAYFHTIDIDGVYEIRLVQDTVCSLTISGTEKEMDKTDFEVRDSVLYLSTGHSGQYLRPHNENMQIEIHLDTLHRIDIHETCKITTPVPLGHGNEEIGIVVDTKLAEIDLNLFCRTFYYWNNPNGTKMKLAGTVQELKVWNAGLAQVDASALNSDYVLCENGSLGNCRVRALQRLEYSLTNQGDIYYYGSPAELVPVLVNSGGQLIKAD